jgi:hypothetical protein
VLLPLDALPQEEVIAVVRDIEADDLLVALD